MERVGDFVAAQNVPVKSSVIVDVADVRSTAPDDAGEHHSDLLLQAGEGGGEVIDFDVLVGRCPGKNWESHASALVARSPLVRVGYEKECGASHQEPQAAVDHL